MRIAICGGTFDPFHRGHLDPVLAVRGTMQWDRVIYVPAWQQPFKADRATTSGYHRFAMAALATRHDHGLYVSPIELERGGVSYSVETMEQLRAMYPEAAFDWIIGEDNLAQLPEWKNPQRLFALVRFVVLARSGGGQPPPGVRVVYAENEIVPISATDIRKRVRAGEPIDGFVDPLVSRYIHHYRLYQEART
jgi:nicotinate-nucleotide adenylyltransferase